jgi:RNA polymerase sigma factor (sigma-70 family)
MRLPNGDKQMRTQAWYPGVSAGNGGRVEASIHPHDLERTFAHYVNPVYRFFYSRVGNREDAEDLTSQVFVKAAQQLDTTRSEASLAGWLFTVARTVLADHWRRYYRTPAPLGLCEEIVADLSIHDSSNGSYPAAEHLVEAVLHALPARYRRVLELRFLQGYTVGEAAGEMGVTVNNLKVLQHRALARAAAIGLPAHGALDAGPHHTEMSA